MESHQEIRHALEKILPQALHDRIPELTSLLEETIERARNSSNSQRESIYNPEFDILLQALAGKEVQTEKTALSFGKGNQFGNVTIRDIAGRDVNNHTIHQI